MIERKISLPSMFPSEEEIKKLDLEVDVWYTLKIDITTIQVYRDGELTKEVKRGSKEFGNKNC